MRNPWIAAAFVLASCSSVDVASEARLQEPATTTATTTAAATEPTATTTTTTAPTTTTTEPTTTTTAPDEAPPPTDAVELAHQLDEIERQLRDQTLEDSDAPAVGRRQQQLYRVLSANPEWEAELLAELADSPVLAAIEENWSARQNLSALVRSSTLSSTLPAWRINAPLPADELVGYYREAEEATGVPWSVLAAINLVETRMGRIEGLSTAGALGPMQFLPSTWEGCCEGDPTVDRDAILGAAVYLTLVGAPEDLPAAVYGYNHSQRYVDAVLAFARVLDADPVAYRGYHAWEVYFLSSAGLIQMPVGYEEPVAVDAATWLADHPDALVGSS